MAGVTDRWHPEPSQEAFEPASPAGDAACGGWQPMHAPLSPSKRAWGPRTDAAASARWHDPQRALAAARPSPWSAAPWQSRHGAAGSVRARCPSVNLPNAAARCEAPAEEVAPWQSPMHWAGPGGAGWGTSRASIWQSEQ